MSVCLPTWESIVGYEMGDFAIVSRMKMGYPRFLFHPKVIQLFDTVDKPNGCTDCLLFMSERSAQECSQYLESRFEEAQVINQLVIMNGCEFYGVFYHHELNATAKEFWQHTGMGISSRFAHAMLSNMDIKSLVKNDSVVKHALKSRVSSYLDSEYVYFFPSGMMLDVMYRNGCDISGSEIGLEALSGFKDGSIRVSIC